MCGKCILSKWIATHDRLVVRCAFRKRLRKFIFSDHAEYTQRGPLSTEHMGPGIKSIKGRYPTSNRTISAVPGDSGHPGNRVATLGVAFQSRPSRSLPLVCRSLPSTSLGFSDFSSELSNFRTSEP